MFYLFHLSASLSINYGLACPPCVMSQYYSSACLPPAMGGTIRVRLASCVRTETGETNCNIPEARVTICNRTLDFIV
ncbi:hypothetical protein QR685DRAFT_536133 [Neurospora intermedia]|uniref:Secreted protein n=1 Tax=Neurospora intermedia TaxID=5142 RepID=A0ABR3D1Z3_NEUIN